MFVPRLIVAVVFQLAFYGSLLLVPAGTLDWPRAWVLLGVLAVATAVTMLRLRRDPALLTERLKPPLQPGQPPWDVAVLLVLVVTYVADVVLVPLDVFRLRLLPAVPPVASAIGLALFVFGWTITSLALERNTFATSVVRHQVERGHAVVDTGVYAVVRHPMYAGGIGLFVGLPLWLGSWAAALAAAVPIALVVVRLVLEERFLRRELPGYVAYAERTRYRLVPFIW